MPWERITHEQQTMQDLRRLLGDVGFYLDHDVDSVVAQMLLWLKHDVETAADVGAESQRDEWHFRRAFETKRVLITKDKDYLDHERFPLSQTCGVIIMNIDTSSEREIARALEVIHFVLARLRQTMVGSKVV